jgi:hypothetical protein
MLMCDVRSERMCHGFNVLSAHEERGSERLAGRILGGKVLREGLLRCDGGASICFIPRSL